MLRWGRSSIDKVLALLGWSRVSDKGGIDGKWVAGTALASQSALSPEGSGSGLGRAILYIYPLIDLYLFYFI